MHVALFKQGPYEHGLVSILHLLPAKYWLHEQINFWVNGSSWHTPLLEQFVKQAVISWFVNVNKLFIWKMFVKSSWFDKVEVLAEVVVSEKAVLVLLVVSDCVCDKVELKMVFTVELIVELLVVKGVVIVVEVVVEVLVIVVVVVVVVDDSKILIKKNPNNFKRYLIDFKNSNQ